MVYPLSRGQMTVERPLCKYTRGYNTAVFSRATAMNAAIGGTEVAA